MTESDFYRRMKKALPQVHWTRIENSIGSGMFDINACYRGYEFWIELKKWNPKKGVYIRPSQYAWSLNRQRQYGNIFVLGFHFLFHRMVLEIPPFSYASVGKLIEVRGNTRYFFPDFDFENLLEKILLNLLNFSRQE